MQQIKKARPCFPFVLTEGLVHRTKFIESFRKERGRIAPEHPQCLRPDELIERAVSADRGAKIGGDLPALLGRKFVFVHLLLVGVIELPPRIRLVRRVVAAFLLKRIKRLLSSKERGAKQIFIAQLLHPVGQKIFHIVGKDKTVAVTTRLAGRERSLKRLVIRLREPDLIPGSDAALFEIGFKGIPKLPSRERIAALIDRIRKLSPVLGNGDEPCRAASAAAHLLRHEIPVGKHLSLGFTFDAHIRSPCLPFSH